MRRQLERREPCHLPIPNLPVRDRFTSRGAGPQFVEHIRPPLGHLHPLIPKLGPVIGATDAVVLDMSKSGFDGVRVPFPGLIGDGRERRAETMGTHFILGVTKAAKGATKGILADWTGIRPDRGENQFAITGEGMKLAKKGNGLTRQGNAMFSPHLHSGGWYRPCGGVKIELVPVGMA